VLTRTHCMCNYCNAKCSRVELLTKLNTGCCIILQGYTTHSYPAVFFFYSLLYCTTSHTLLHHLQYIPCPAYITVSQNCDGRENGIPYAYTHTHIYIYIYCSSNFSRVYRIYRSECCTVRTAPPLPLQIRTVCFYLYRTTKGTHEQQLRCCAFITASHPAIFSLDILSVREGEELPLYSILAYSSILDMHFCLRTSAVVTMYTALYKNFIPTSAVL